MMRWIDLLTFPVGHPQGGLAVAVALLVRLVLVAAYGWFVVAGLRTDWKWGIGNLLFPPAALAFFYLYPDRGRRPGVLFVTGMIAFMLSVVVFKQERLEPQGRGYSPPAARSAQPTP